MCTLIVAKNVFDGFPVVVAANRDELLDRPSETPAMRDEELGIYAPKDLQRGGAWIGVNKFGVLAALTNRLDVHSESGRKSRGDLIINALKHKSAIEAHEYLAHLDAEDFNGFNFVAADKNKVFLVRGNGRVFKSIDEGDGLLVVSNHGVGREIKMDTMRRVENVLMLWANHKIFKQNPTPGDLAALLEIHDEWRYGTCISQPEENYGTKSSSIIRLKVSEDGDEWHYWHRERPNAQVHVCAAKFGDRFVLPVVR